MAITAKIMTSQIFFLTQVLKPFFWKGSPTRVVIKWFLVVKNGKNQYFWKFGQISRICTSTKNHLFFLFTTMVTPVQCMQNVVKKCRLRIEKVWGWYLKNWGGGGGLRWIYQLGRNGHNRHKNHPIRFFSPPNNFSIHSKCFTKRLWV